MTTYTVEILVDVVERPHLRHETWGHHSEHQSYRNAVDQADMVGGRVTIDDGMLDTEAYQWAVDNQGFGGDYQEWRSLDDSERGEYEDGANGLPTTERTK
jgi:hypothetical protein